MDQPMDNLRKLATSVCCVVILGETVSLPVIPFADQSAHYMMMPNIAADHEKLHPEREDFTPTGWAASRVFAFDSSSGATYMGNTAFPRLLYNSLGLSESILFVVTEG